MAGPCGKECAANPADLKRAMAMCCDSDACNMTGGKQNGKNHNLA